MPYCAKCGKELAEDAKFCPYCGTPVGEEKVKRRPRYEEEREACFGGRDVGPWGAISGGVFLIGWVSFGTLTCGGRGFSS